MQKQKPIIKISSDADLVTVAPFLLGYQVRNSMVLLTLCGQRSPGGFRIKLPDKTLSKSVITEMCGVVTGMLHRIKDITQIAIILYSDESITSDELPHSKLVSDTIKAVQKLGTPILTTLCVTDKDWANYSTPAKVFNISKTKSQGLAKRCEKLTDRTPLEIDVISQSSPAPIAEISRICTESEWFAEIMALLTPPAVWQNIMESTQTKHGCTVYQHLMLENGNLRPVSEREYAIKKIILQASRFRCSSSHYRRRQHLYAQLCAIAESDTERNIALSLRALSWWAIGMRGIAQEILRSISDHTDSTQEEISYLNLTATIIEISALPQYFTETNWLKEMTTD